VSFPSISVGILRSERSNEEVFQCASENETREVIQVLRVFFVLLIARPVFVLCLQNLNEMLRKKVFFIF